MLEQHAMNIASIATRLLQLNGTHICITLVQIRHNKFCPEVRQHLLPFVTG